MAKAKPQPPQPQSQIFKFEPAVPCATWDGEKLCEKPATVASGWRTGRGEWILLPMCKDCVTATAKVYGVGDKS